MSGAVRPVAQPAARLKEAQKLGFTRAIVPEGSAEGGSLVRGVSNLASLVAEIRGQATDDSARTNESW